MTNIEKIKAEIESRMNDCKLPNGKFASSNGIVRFEELQCLLSFIDSLEKEEQEDADFVKQELERIREAEKKIKLPELIDFWWMQEDMEGNRMVTKSKKHFERAMKKAYNVGLSQSESLEEDVDLEKELDDWRHKHFKGKRDGDYSGEYLERESQLSIASHFYELGKTQKKNNIE